MDPPAPRSRSGRAPKVRLVQRGSAGARGSFAVVGKRPQYSIPAGFVSERRFPGVGDPREEVWYRNSVEAVGDGAFEFVVEEPREGGLVVRDRNLNKAWKRVSDAVAEAGKGKSDALPLPKQMNGAHMFGFATQEIVAAVTEFLGFDAVKDDAATTPSAAATPAKLATASEDPAASPPPSQPPPPPPQQQQQQYKGEGHKNESHKGGEEDHKEPITQTLLISELDEKVARGELDVAMTLIKHTRSEIIRHGGDPDESGFNSTWKVLLTTTYPDSDSDSDTATDVGGGGAGGGGGGRSTEPARSSSNANNGGDVVLVDEEGDNHVIVVEPSPPAQAPPLQSASPTTTITKLIDPTGTFSCATAAMVLARIGLLCGKLAKFALPLSSRHLHMWRLKVEEDTATEPDPGALSRMLTDKQKRDFISSSFTVVTSTGSGNLGQWRLAGPTTLVPGPGFTSVVTLAGILPLPRSVNPSTGRVVGLSNRNLKVDCGTYLVPGLGLQCVVSFRDMVLGRGDTPREAFAQAFHPQSSLWQSVALGWWTSPPTPDLTALAEALAAAAASTSRKRRGTPQAVASAPTSSTSSQPEPENVKRARTDDVSPPLEGGGDDVVLMMDVDGGGPGQDLMELQEPLSHQQHQQPGEPLPPSRSETLEWVDDMGWVPHDSRGGLGLVPVFTIAPGTSEVVLSELGPSKTFHRDRGMKGRALQQDRLSSVLRLGDVIEAAQFKENPSQWVTDPLRLRNDLAKGFLRLRFRRPRPLTRVKRDAVPLAHLHAAVSENDVMANELFGLGLNAHVYLEHLSTREEPPLTVTYPTYKPVFSRSAAEFDACKGAVTELRARLEKDMEEASALRSWARKNVPQEDALRLSTWDPASVWDAPPDRDDLETALRTVLPGGMFPLEATRVLRALTMVYPNPSPREEEEVARVLHMTVMMADVLVPTPARNRVFPPSSMEHAVMAVAREGVQGSKALLARMGDFFPALTMPPTTISTATSTTPATMMEECDEAFRTKRLACMLSNLAFRMHLIPKTFDHEDGLRTSGSRYLRLKEPERKASFRRALEAYVIPPQWQSISPNFSLGPAFLRDLNATNPSSRMSPLLDHVCDSMHFDEDVPLPQPLRAASDVLTLVSGIVSSQRHSAFELDVRNAMEEAVVSCSSLEELWTVLCRDPLTRDLPRGLVVAWCVRRYRNIASQQDSELRHARDVMRTILAQLEASVHVGGGAEGQGSGNDARAVVVEDGCLAHLRKCREVYNRTGFETLAADVSSSLPPMSSWSTELTPHFVLLTGLPSALSVLNGFYVMDTSKAARQMASRVKRFVFVGPEEDSTWRRGGQVSPSTFVRGDDVSIEEGDGEEEEDEEEEEEEEDEDMDVVALPRAFVGRWSLFLCKGTEERPTTGDARTKRNAAPVIRDDGFWALGTGEDDEFVAVGNPKGSEWWLPRDLLPGGGGAKVKRAEGGVRNGDNDDDGVSVASSSSGGSSASSSSSSSNSSSSSSSSSNHDDGGLEYVKTTRVVVHGAKRFEEYDGV